MWKSIRAFFVKLAGEVEADAAKVLQRVEPMFLAYVRNLEAVGIADCEAFLASAAEIALSLARSYADGSKSGTEIRQLAAEALRNKAGELGADLAHDSLNSVINTTLELAHQPQVSERQPQGG